jgi:competence protein ComEC
MDGNRAHRVSRWHRYVEAAVRDTAGKDRPGGAASVDDAPESIPAAGAPVRDTIGSRDPVASRDTVASMRRLGLVRLSAFRDRLRSRLVPEERAAGEDDARRRRLDLRLVPAALVVWVSAGAAPWLAPAWLLGLCLVMTGAAALVLAGTVRQRRRAGMTTTGTRADGKPPACRPSACRPAGRSFPLTMAAALFLAAATAAHSAVSSAQRHEGPVAAAIAAKASSLAELEITGAPRALTASGGPGLSSRWVVNATIKSLSTGGQLLRADTAVVIMGGPGWQHVVPGQKVRAAGKLRPADPGQVEAGLLAASSSPLPLEPAGALTAGPASLGRDFARAAGWLNPDARGLLPGMVMGDTGNLDEQLEVSMQTVGLTHLTAVSGANCSLILGALLLAARSLRLPRLPAALVALAGLGLFVLMVGPDASVLRASLMGAIALVSLTGGRTGRGLSFLCLAVIGLLLIDPALGTSFGFLLSVLATLGIILLGRQIAGWVPLAVPRWVAAGLAVPLSAQLLCGPVVVLLQPQFATYSLLANVLVAPLVAPVTILGTMAVPLVPLVPFAAAALMGAAGLFATGVAGVARFMAGLPGAAPSWPEGPFGMFTMVLFSALNVLVVWLAARPRRTLQAVYAAHRALTEALERSERRKHPSTRKYVSIRQYLWPDTWGSSRRPARGLVRRVTRGRLRISSPYPRRNQEWRQPRRNDPKRRRPIRPPGGT